ncbi:MAG TPA: diguanylate cyclase [Catenuloplanes sp.]
MSSASPASSTVGGQGGVDRGSSARGAAANTTLRGVVAGLEIVGELGRGAATVVYRVRRQQDEYALKLLDSPGSDTARTLRLFRREAALLAGVDHPGLPRIHEVGEHCGLPYLVMDVVEGQPLAQLLARGPVPAAQTVSLAIDIAGALAAMHRTGLVHRDIKPENMMVLGTGEARLIDFGLATLHAADERDLAVGTLAYASPEQAGTLKRPVDQRSDLYALGVVLFACVTGTLPFSSPDVGELLRMHAVAPPPDPAALVPGLGSGLASVILRLLAKDPDDRYQSGDVLLADLRRLAEDPDARFTAGAGEPNETALEPLSGRKAELDALRARWERARRGRGGGCLIRGAGGAGKSRLAHELAGIARAQGALVLHGKSSPDDAIPLAPFRTAVASWLRTVAGLPAAQRDAAHDLLRSAAGSAAPLLGALSQPLARLLAAGPLAEEDRHEQFHAAVAGFLAGLARQNGALVLLLDDVQWLDAGSRRVLQQLASELADTPLLIVATARDDEGSRAGTASFEAALGAAVDEKLSLAPLDDDEVALLVTARLPGIGAGSRLARLLNVRGNGNPFVIIEYLRAVVDAGLLRPSWGRWLLDEDALDALELPQDALGLVLTRVRGLGADSRRLLTAAAVTGARFRLDLVADVCGLDRGLAADLIGEAAGRALVEARGSGQYAFLHDRIREALLADLDEAASAELNQRIAETLDAAGATEPTEIYGVAQHYMLGRGTPAGRVVSACLAAGRLALDDHAPDRAINFLAHAQACGLTPDSAFLKLYGIALARDGRHAEAKDRFERALTMQDDPLGRADLLVLLANVYRANWDTTGALQAVRRGLAEVGSPWQRNRLGFFFSTIALVVAGALVAATKIGAGRATGRDRERFSLVCALHEVGAYVCIIGLQPEEMVLHGLRSLYAAGRLGRSPQYVRAVGSLGLTLGALGLPRLARAVFAPAIRVADGIGDPRLVADVASQVGAAAFLGGTDDGETWERALAEHGRWLDAGRYSDGVAAICWELAAMGRTAEALSWYERGRARVLSQGRDETTALVTFGAFTLTLVGRVTDASAELSRVHTLLDGHGGRGLRVNVVLTRLHALVEQADFGARFEELVAEFNDFGLRPRSMIRPHRLFAVYEVTGRLAQCRAVDGDRRTARLPAARAALRRLHQVAGTPFLRSWERVARADLALLEGRAAAALTLLGELVPARRDAPVVALEGARVRARALLALGHGDEAIRQARFAQSVAIAQGWPHRERWVMAEFGVAALSGSATHGFGPSVMAGAENVYRQRLQALEEVSKAAARVLDPDVLARIALDEIIRILAADRAFLFLAAPDDDRLVPHLGRDGQGHDVDTPTAYSATLVERVRATGEPLVVAGTEEGGANLAQSVVLHGLRSIMAAPIQLDGRLLGVVYLDSRVAKGIFTPDDVGILTALTNHIATSFATARAAQLEVSVQSARQQRDVAETLRQALTQMSGEHDPARVLVQLLDTAARILPCDDAWLVVRQGPGLVLIGAADGDPDRSGRAIAADPAVTALLDAPGPVLGGPATAPPRALAGGRAPVGSWMSLPLPARRAGLGALVVASSRAEVYQEAQVELGSALAVQGATAYANASLLAQVQALATVDELTGVPNRRGFFDVAARELTGARRPGRALSAVMVDIDHFKQVNDSYGHITGDEVIRAVATRLTERVRRTDTVGRYGGEEFALVMPDTGLDRAARVAEELRAAVADTPLDTRSGALTVTVSIGVAELRPDDDVVGLLARADEALYRAKTGGRNRVCSA